MIEEIAALVIKALLALGLFVLGYYAMRVCLDAGESLAAGASMVVTLTIWLSPDS